MVQIAQKHSPNSLWMHLPQNKFLFEILTKMLTFVIMLSSKPIDFQLTLSIFKCNIFKEYPLQSSILQSYSASQRTIRYFWLYKFGPRANLPIFIYTIKYTESEVSLPTASISVNTLFNIEKLRCFSTFYTWRLIIQIWPEMSLPTAAISVLLHSSIFRNPIGSERYIWCLNVYKLSNS